jgi:Mn-containing catalase
MQYSIQGLNCDDPERKDMLMDIGTEELSHLEVVGTLARMHLKPLRHNRDAAEVDPLIAIAGGGGVALHNSMGDPWTADYLKITGELDVDLRSDIAAEARAKIVYERLIQFTDDPGTIQALQFLMTREITHMKAFTAALESMGKKPFSIGSLPPSPDLVRQYFDDSTGTGDRGEPNARGPWNDGEDIERVEAPAFRELASQMQGTRKANGSKRRRGRGWSGPQVEASRRRCGLCAVSRAAFSPDLFIVHFLPHNAGCGGCFFLTRAARLSEPLSFARHTHSAGSPASPRFPQPVYYVCLPPASEPANPSN